MTGAVDTPRERPLVAMVVNNAVAHDARVMKSAVTLCRAGAHVEVLGVSPTSATERGRAGEVGLRRLPVLPPRGVNVPYAWWAARRRLGRLAPADRWPLSLPVTRYYRRAFLPALRQLRPDVVHVHDVHLLAVAVEFLQSTSGGGRGAKLVYDAHEYVAGLAVSGARTQRAVDAWAALERQHIRGADRVITVAPAIAERLQSEHRLSRRPTVVFNAPIAWDQPTSSLDLREQCAVGPRTPLLVYSGALSAARGVDTLVRALGLLPNVHAAVVGVPYPHPLSRGLMALADEVHARDRLHFVPPVASHEVPAYLSGADVAVSPIVGDAASYGMALPNKLFEYVHAGLPIVTSDAKAMADFVAAHGLGEVFEAGDADALATAVRRVLENPPRPDTAEIRSTYSWQGQEPALVSLYRELVEGLLMPPAVWTPTDLRADWAVE